jgi:hypothetical protein
MGRVWPGGGRYGELRAVARKVVRTQRYSSWGTSDNVCTSVACRGGRVDAPYAVVLGPRSLLCGDDNFSAF